MVFNKRKLPGTSPASFEAAEDETIGFTKDILRNFEWIKVDEFGVQIVEAVLPGVPD